MATFISTAATGVTSPGCTLLFESCTPVHMLSLPACGSITYILHSQRPLVLDRLWAARQRHCQIVLKQRAFLQRLYGTQAWGGDEGGGRVGKVE